MWIFYQQVVASNASSCVLSLPVSGKANSREVWRREAACCSACSTYLRPVMATCRARPRTGPGEGCVWASSAAPTWQPWMSTATLTPTLKRKALTEWHMVETHTRIPTLFKEKSNLTLLGKIRPLLWEGAYRR